MAYPNLVIIESLDIHNFLNFWPTLIKLVSKSMSYEDICFETYCSLRLLLHKTDWKKKEKKKKKRTLQAWLQLSNLLNKVYFGQYMRLIIPQKGKKKPGVKKKKKKKKMVIDKETGKEKEVEVELEEFVYDWRTCVCGANHPPIPDFDPPDAKRCTYYWVNHQAFPS